jgi:hypothetical protein
MYTYEVIEDYRDAVPQTRTGTVGPFLLFALHDTEGGTGDVGAIGTLYFLMQRADRNASYHELWSWDEDKRRFRVRRIVPPTSAAHSLNPFPPFKGGSYEPDAVVRHALGARVNDPNRVVYAVAIAGRKADVERYASIPDFVHAAKRRLTELRAELKMPNRMAEHFRFNPSTRSDWGLSLTPAIEGLLDMVIRTPIVTEEWDTIPGVASTFIRMDGSTGYFTEAARVKSIAEVTLPDGADARLLDYGENHEALVIKRKGLVPIPGTRIVGSPKEVVTEVPTGLTQADLDKARESGASEEKSRLRQLLGI